MKMLCIFLFVNPNKMFTFYIPGVSHLFSYIFLFSHLLEELFFLTAATRVFNLVYYVLYWSTYRIVPVAHTLYTFYITLLYLLISMTLLKSHEQSFLCFVQTFLELSAVQVWICGGSFLSFLIPFTLIEGINVTAIAT